MSERLAGRAAIVTGGSRGLGLATTRALVAAGARVALLARDESSLATAAREIGDAAVPVRADVSDPDSVREAFARARGALGRLDVLVNNAGIGRLHRIEDVTDEALRAQVDTNILGTVYCCREAIPLLRASGGGDIVNLSSEAVRDPYPFLTVYAATKGAIEVFTRGLRREVRGDGIRVTLLRSGPSVTTFGDAWDPELSALASQAWTEGGYLGVDGMLDPTAVGDAIVHAVTQPHGASVETVELRPSPGGPGRRD